MAHSGGEAAGFFYPVAPRVTGEIWIENPTAVARDLGSMIQLKHEFSNFVNRNPLSGFLNRNPTLSTRFLIPTLRVYSGLGT
jgi:hypothetical protein